MQKQMTTEEYTEAVKKLLPLAQGDTEKNRVAALVLLSACNSREFPLDIAELRELDINDYFAAMIVIRGRVELDTVPQYLIEDESRIFGELRQKWGVTHPNKRNVSYE